MEIFKLLHSIVFTGLFFLSIITCNCCPCCCSKKVHNKYSFLKGQIKVQQVKEEKDISFKIIADIKRITPNVSFSLYERKMSKCKINNDNKIQYYIIFTTINYILALTKNFAKYIKNEYGTIHDPKMSSLTSFIDTKITDVFETTVTPGQETDSNDLIMPVRNKCNELFSMVITESQNDCLTGYKTI